VKRYRSAGPAGVPRGHLLGFPCRLVLTSLNRFLVEILARLTELRAVFREDLVDLRRFDPAYFRRRPTETVRRLVTFRRRPMETLRLEEVLRFLEP